MSVKYTLTNLIPATSSSFEGSGWSGGSYSSSYAYHGSKSYAITGSATSTEKLIYLSTSVYQTQNHTYYWRLYEYHTSPSINGCELDIYWKEAEPYMGKHQYGMANKWNMLSGTNVRSSWASANQQFRLDYNNLYNTATVYYDAFMVIDLTANFGSGYEPSKEWCDAIIPYFTGTYTLSVGTNENYNTYSDNSGFDVKEVSDLIKNINGARQRRGWPVSNYSQIVSSMSGNKVSTQQLEEAIRRSVDYSGYKVKYTDSSFSFLKLKSGSKINADYLNTLQTLQLDMDNKLGCSNCIETCGANCVIDCASACSTNNCGSSCSGGCQNGCTRTCGGSCSGCGRNCSGTCQNSCDNSDCWGQCDSHCGDCSGNCYSTCADDCYESG